MSKRLQFHQHLVDLIGPRPDGKPNVYFQPPGDEDINYPCIIYRRSRPDVKHADDSVYQNTQGYMLIVIDPDPDSPIPDKVGKLPFCRFDRFYTTNQLNHDVFNVFY